MICPLAFYNWNHASYPLIIPERTDHLETVSYWPTGTEPSASWRREDAFPDPSYHPLDMNLMGDGSQMNIHKEELVRCKWGLSRWVSPNHRAPQGPFYAKDAGQVWTGNTHGQYTWYPHQRAPVMLITDLLHSWFLWPDSRDLDPGVGFITDKVNSHTIDISYPLKAYSPSPETMPTTHCVCK
jgi:hypothetical protein